MTFIDHVTALLPDLNAESACQIMIASRWDAGTMHITLHLAWGDETRHLLEEADQVPLDTIDGHAAAVIALLEKQGWHSVERHAVYTHNTVYRKGDFVQPSGTDEIHYRLTREE